MLHHYHVRATWRAAAFKYALLMHRHPHAQTDPCKHVVNESEKAREREGKKRKSIPRTITLNHPPVVAERNVLFCVFAVFLDSSAFRIDVAAKLAEIRLTLKKLYIQPYLTSDMRHLLGRTLWKGLVCR